MLKINNLFSCLHLLINSELLLTNISWFGNLIINNYFKSNQNKVKRKWDSNLRTKHYQEIVEIRTELPIEGSSEMNNGVYESNVYIILGEILFEKCKVGGRKSSKQQKIIKK